MNIYEKLQKCRCDLQNAKLKKSGKNKFAGFEYFELKDFLPTVNKLFADVKLFSNFSIEEKATLTIIDTEKPDDKLVFTSPIASLELKGCNEIQALGGVHTYLKRYLYLNALEIVESDLFDSVANKKQPTKTETTKPKDPTEEIAKELAKDCPENIDEFLKDIRSINDITDLREYYKSNIKLFKENETLALAFDARATELKEAVN